MANNPVVSITLLQRRTILRRGKNQALARVCAGGDGEQPHASAADRGFSPLLREARAADLLQ